MTTPTVEERIANLEGSFAQIATRLDRVEIDLRDLRTEMNARFDQMERQFTARIDQVTARITGCSKKPIRGSTRWSGSSPPALTK